MSKALEPKQDGYYRNIGYKQQGSRSQPKIRLGKDKVQATERLARIVQLWDLWQDQPQFKGCWAAVVLAMAKAIGQGDKYYALALTIEQHPFCKFDILFGLN